MSAHPAIIAAFSEEQTARLTGITTSQLRYWDRTHFYRPSYAEENRHAPFSRVYAFKDIVALRVLNLLRNDIGVSVQHLREVSLRLSGSNADRWSGVRLWVLSKRVVWQEPGTDMPQEIVSRQYVAPAVILDDVINSTKEQVAHFSHQRDQEKIGTIERNRYINHNAPVLAGTRIPVQAIQRFSEAGYSSNQILKEYPDLTPDDIAAALRYKSNSTAA